MHLKSLCTYLILISSFYSGLAQDPEPILLHRPIDWRYEKIDFPLSFAPDLPYEGFEELRFAPGMFDTLSATYFTYVFAISFDNKVKLSETELADFLTAYYRGLCQAVAESRELSVDTSQVSIKLEKIGQKYQAKVTYLDTFTNSKQVTLHMELEHVTMKRARKSYLLALVSPQPKESEVWSELYGIRKSIIYDRKG